MLQVSPIPITQLIKFVEGSPHRTETVTVTGCRHHRTNAQISGGFSFSNAGGVRNLRISLGGTTIYSREYQIPRYRIQLPEFFLFGEIQIFIDVAGDTPPNLHYRTMSLNDSELLEYVPVYFLLDEYFVLYHDSHGFVCKRIASTGLNERILTGHPTKYWRVIVRQSRETILSKMPGFICHLASSDPRYAAALLDNKLIFEVHEYLAYMRHRIEPYGGEKHADILFDQYRRTHADK